MTTYIDLLSGGIPGGAILLIATLIFINLAIFFLYKSGLFKSGLAKKFIGYNITVLALYTLLWVYNKPVPLPYRIVVLPSGTEEHFEIDAKSLRLPEFFEKNGYVFEGRYLVHKWRWLYNTLGEERIKSYDRWVQLGENLRPYLLLKSRYNDNDDLVVKAIYSDKSNTNIEITVSKSAWDIGLPTLLSKLNLKKKGHSKIVTVDDKYLSVKLKIVENKINEAMALAENDTTLQGKLYLAEALVYKGLKFVYDQEKLNFVKIVNPDFEKAKAILYPIIKSKGDHPTAAYLLGRMAIREQDYEAAEVFFKIAFSQELWNSDVYYYLSFLLPSRLKELGYENRKRILEKAVQLNPGNTNAVYDLADAYYITGNGAVQGSGTQDALKTLENYLVLNDEDPKIQSLLATIFIKTEKLGEAEAIYNDMASRYPDDSNIVYNLGVVLFTRGKYKEALEKFKKAIKMDNNLDAYLYAGITCENLGDEDNALKYYKDRVRFKKSDDDSYAREAMRGIRKILEERAYKNKKRDSLN